MEFRIFIPWTVSCSSLLTSDFSDRAEQRVDSYVVTPDHVGIKVRNLKKLEMKVRTKIDELSGIETYVKVKFGKKDISRYTSDILQTLTNMGISDHNELKYCLNNVKYLEISKKRVIISDRLCTLEICAVQVGDKDWLSIAIEGDDMNDIQNALKESTHEKAIQIKELLKETLQFIPSAFNEDTSFIPFVGGYPRFIRLVCTGSTNEERRRLLESYSDIITNLL